MLPSIDKILFATDLSKNASEAAKYTVYLAKLTGAEIHVLHVAEKLSADAIVTLETYISDPVERRKGLSGRTARLKEQLMGQVDAFWKLQDEGDREVRRQMAAVEVCEGYPAEEILKKVAEIKVDLVVMGAHEKGLVHTFLGSVAKSVLRRSRVPIVVVPLP
jgi:nucleotide-binding universal stress UspA family protein